MGATTITATIDHSRHATASLMEAVVELGNMQLAYKRVMLNKGAAGIDKMQVEDLVANIRTNWANIREQLLEGAYRPQTVLGGWAHYDCLAEVKGTFEALDGWMRRKLRDILWR